MYRLDDDRIIINGSINSLKVISIDKKEIIKEIKILFYVWELN